jgi:hypothetical protein
MDVRTLPSPRLHRRDVLLVGAFVVGWSVARAAARPPATVRPPSGRTKVVDAALPSATATLTRPRRRRRLPTIAATVAVLLLVAAGGLTLSPDDASAPLIAPAVAARERAATLKRLETARLNGLRRLQLSGIAGRRVGLSVTERPTPVLPPAPVLRPSERTIALETYIQALGVDTILRGLTASRSELEQQVLHDARVNIYSGGTGDIQAEKIDVRVLAMIEYLAQANGEVTVTCLVTGHSYFVHGRPGVVSAHTYGRAVDIGAVGGISILGNQGAGTITERAIKQILALPAAVAPRQVISLMALGGPSFALPDHYNHIHIGY